MSKGASLIMHCALCIVHYFKAVYIYIPPDFLRGIIKDGVAGAHEQAGEVILHLVINAYFSPFL